MEAKKWEDNGGRLYYKHVKPVYPKLENAVYVLQRDEYGKSYLEKLEDEFTFDYKLYGLESGLINRVVKTYNHKTGNIGILLNGVKGTGKSVTAKLLCNKLQQPTILVTEYTYNEAILMMASIQQNITIFIDEYEKIFGDKSELLSIMDGALNSTHRRMFLLTTNTLYVNDNLIDRPSRIRYKKTFGNLTLSVLTEVVDDRLKQKELRQQTIDFLSTLNTITIDSVNAVIDEINIHSEEPKIFERVFNVTKGKAGEVNLSPEDGDELVDIHSVADEVVVTDSLPRASSTSKYSEEISISFASENNSEAGEKKSNS